MRQQLQREVPPLLQRDSDETAYLKEVIERATIPVPLIHFDRILEPQDSYEVVRGVQMWIITYQIPCDGDILLMEYLPRTGSGLRWPEVYLEGHTTANKALLFQAQVVNTLEKDIQPILAKKKETLDFLKNRLDGITPEIVEYNAGLENFVRGLFASIKQKHQANKDLLRQL